MNKISTFLLCCFFLFAVSSQASLRVVVLGSSTSAGTGATAGNSWVAKYRTYLKGLNSENEVINLAVGGYTSYRIMPTGNIAPGKQDPDVDRNITRALALAPDVIIINMPTNDAAYDYTVDETMDNFAAVIALATAENVPVFISTSQGRNFPWPADPNVSVTKRNLLISLTNRINSTYGANALDFWTTLANSDGSVNPLYDSGDGIHLNDAGHAILYNRVVAKTAILTYARSDESPQNINIDLGTLVQTAPSQWNALTDFTTNGRINNLKTSDGTKSGIYVYVHDDFSGVNLNGAIQNGLGYPQRVSEDSFFGENGNPSGGITLGGLSVGKKYRFRIYAGRMTSAGDPVSRQTKYVAVGQNTVESSLEVTNNNGDNDNYATINDIVPDANGMVTITASKGSANNTADGYFYMGTIEIQATQVVVINSPGASGTILIDFGSSATTTPGNWNNFTATGVTGTKTNLINATGATTGYNMFISDNFQDVNTDGTTANTNYPVTATRDSFYGSNSNTTGGVTLENLDPSKKYSFKLFSSRAGLGSTPDNRETEFTVTGNTEKKVYLNTSNNINGTVAANDMIPDASGKIIITVKAGANNTNSSKFFYLGMIEMTYETVVLPVRLLSFSGNRTLSGNQLEWKTTNEVNNKGFDLLRIENNTAKNIGTIDAKNAAQNAYTFIDREPSLGDNYYRLNQIDNNGASVLSEVIVVKGEKLAFSASFSAEKLSVLASAQKGEGKLMLSDLTGRIVMKENISLEEGNNHYIFTAPGLPSGVYILSLVEKTGPRNIKILKR